MPNQIVERGEDRIWGLWKIEESEEALAKAVIEPVPQNIHKAEKRLEWLAVRALTVRLLAEWSLSYKGIHKDGNGKPFLTGHAVNLSLSHSWPWVAAIMDRNANVGIDLEQPKVKLLRIAPRVLSPGELQDAGEDVKKHCIYWCAKEALIKIHGSKELTLSSQLLIDPFAMGEKGEILGRIIERDNERLIPLYYSVTPEFVLVFNR